MPTVSARHLTLRLGLMVKAAMVCRISSQVVIKAGSLSAGSD